MEKIKSNTSERGQTVVEYIFLTAVVVSLAVAVFNSPVFKRFLGKDSEFFTALRKVFMVSYRHSLYESSINPSVNPEEDYTGVHKSYVGDNSTRFFTPTTPYER